MRVVLEKPAEKALRAFNEPLKGRIRKALHKLSLEPPHGDIKPLEGRNGFRVRVGGYRIIFYIENGVLVVADIETRGQVYKGGSKR